MCNLLCEFAKKPGVDSELGDYLRSLRNSDAKALAAYLSATSPSVNTLRETIRICREICIRDELSISELLEQLRLEEFLQSGMSRKQKALAFRKELEALRYPERTRIQREVKATIASIRRDFGAVLTIPKDFEGLKLSISFDIKEASDLNELSQKCSRLATSPDMLQLFKLLRGED